MRNGIHMNVGGFSGRVQEYLRASGYSQKELAKELGLHPKVLSRKLHGSGDAHLTSQDVHGIIITLVDWHVITSQDEVFHLLELAQMGPTTFSHDEWRIPPLSKLTANHAIPSSNLRVPTSTPQHNLPAPATRLIGREWAVERLQQLLGHDEVRLVTLVGSGGSGKTRLALHVARELVGMFAQGVCFVALGGVSDPTLVPISISQALNSNPAPELSPVQGLISYLRNRQLLLVLDNFEQVRDATGLVDELLAAALGLKVLITSRIALHLHDEHEFSVPPLDIPDPAITTGTAELLQYGAVQLFVERAQAVVPDFALTPENGAAIAQICARVDGLPLALELAAARVKTLSPTLLLGRISRERLSVLTRGARNLPDRQQTLRNTIMWSYDLLSSVEQAELPRLGIFTGGWSLEAAEAMMQRLATDGKDSISPLHVLEQLVDSSLLVKLPTAGGQERFTMLETLREYALERLTAQGELERLRNWHACYYLEVAEAAEIGLRGPEQLIWLARLAADRDNFRSALEWSLSRARAGMSIGTPSFFQKGKEVPDVGLLAVELCLRLAAALRPYWEWQGYLTEGRDWLRAALALPIEVRAGKTVRAARAKALSEAARLVCLQNDQRRAAELADESIALWRQLDNPGGLAMALLHRGWAAYASGEYEVAKSVYWEEGLQQLPPNGDTWLRAQLLFHLGAAAGFTFDFEQMRSFYRQSRELFEYVGDKSSVADVLKDQGGMSLLEGKCEEAIDYLLKSLKLCYELGHRQFVATGLCLLGLAFGLVEKPTPVLASIHSAQITAAAEGLMDAIGLTPWTRTNPFISMIHQQIRSRVDEENWQSAWAFGRSLTAEQAIALAYRLGEEVRF